MKSPNYINIFAVISRQRERFRKVVRSDVVPIYGHDSVARLD